MNARPGPLEGLAALLVGVAVLGMAFALEANGLSVSGAAEAAPPSVQVPAPTRAS